MDKSRHATLDISSMEVATNHRGDNRCAPRSQRPRSQRGGQLSTPGGSPVFAMQGTSMSEEKSLPSCVYCTFKGSQIPVKVGASPVRLSKTS